MNSEMTNDAGDFMPDLPRQLANPTSGKIKYWLSKLKMGRPTGLEPAILPRPSGKSLSIGENTFWNTPKHLDALSLLLPLKYRNGLA